MRYIVKLKPLEPFFFGGEYTFGRDDSRVDTKEGSRYFAKSEYLPQQSTILGMLRKTILNKKGIMTLHKNGEWVEHRYNEAEKLVGKGKFSYESDFKLGSVEKVSPIFICKGETAYFLAEADRTFRPKIREGSMIINSKPQKIIEFDGYDPKNSPSTRLVSAIWSMDIDKSFRAVESVGIKKINRQDNRATINNDDAFFRKRAYIFNDNEVFSFIFESSEDMLFLDQSIVSLGADQSSFLLNIEETDKSFEKMTQRVFESKDGFDRLVLLGETLLSYDSYKLCDFIMGERKTKRHLVGKAKWQKKEQKSKRYYLFERGAVLYTNQLEELEKELKNNHLQNIGLNHYIALKGKKHAQ